MQANPTTLYYSPLACSLAPRIALYEAGADVAFVEIDPISKRTSDGRDYLAIHGLGLVPALAFADGELLVENAAILQAIAARYPDARLAPTDAWGRARLQQWLSFVGSELHKAVFVPQFDKHAPPAVREYARAKAPKRLAWLAEQLAGRAHLLDQFSVADAYLATVLNWTVATSIDLSPWPALRAYHAGILARPHVARAVAEERGLYLAELQRHGEPRPKWAPAAK